MKICSVEARSFHAERRTDRQRDRQEKRQTDGYIRQSCFCFSQFCERP